MFILYQGDFSMDCKSEAGHGRRSHLSLSPDLGPFNRFMSDNQSWILRFNDAASIWGGWGAVRFVLAIRHLYNSSPKTWFRSQETTDWVPPILQHTHFPTWVFLPIYVYWRRWAKNAWNFHPSQSGMAVKPMIQFSLFTGGWLWGRCQEQKPWVGGGCHGCHWTYFSFGF